MFRRIFGTVTDIMSCEPFPPTHFCVTLTLLA